ncbi:hypothetical protein SULI_00675 [Saccharolobus solfataricus]|uniref:Uncharacterized protein n=3 Tax=Saccharolobus solfataricus TaxID=2287 RepID=Q97WA7_SACS2|nr:hypothetical protein [Saccharolobus solfataricus]AAK42481.1 Hypothetical protein SSO2328 [Saccharolobus solfataricus P2]AKA72582.1 hypothetical protein SULB_0134 [Saccharolobus solfataricus]AKA75281.1 hypothetical protein SULC_0133 [Saccharolobus solfataricus]AKA77974.1 hypothetical protein SULA_0133 [Saccharolobus solfataricus]AZF67093.1 hypothetical protein SULG_00675 [Saccharolobus solfataricus]
MELINVSLLYLVTGNYTHYLMLITILNVSKNFAIINMTEISHNITLSYVVAYPIFLLYIPNVTQQSIVTQFEGISTTIVNILNFTIYVDVYNSIVVHYIGNGINVTLIGATIPLGPGVYKPIPSYILGHQRTGSTVEEYEIFLLTIVLVVSFYVIFERMNKK